jgi:hypothetical protein
MSERAEIPDREETIRREVAAIEEAEESADPAELETR